MKEVIYVYKNSEGELNMAMTTESFLMICLIFLVLPLITLIMWIYFLFSNKVRLITREDYYRQRANYHKKQAQLKN